MIDFIIDFLTNNKIETAITIIIGLTTIIGYIFREKFKSKIVVSVKFFISIILFLAPHGIVELIESNKKILKLREECIKEIESSIKSSIKYDCDGCEYYYIRDGYIFQKLGITEIEVGKRYHENILKIIRVIKNKINKGYFDKKIKQMEQEDYF